MILDELLEFADNVSVAGSAGTALIGDVIDLEASGLNPGIGEDLWLVLRTGNTEIITGGTAGTIQFTLASDAQAAVATDGSATVHLLSASLVSDDAAANSDALNAGGVILAAKLPSGSYERYLGVLCTIGTTAVTAGTINAFLTKDFASWKAYADALS